MTIRHLFTAFLVILFGACSLSAGETEIIQLADAYLEKPGDAQLEKSLAAYDGQIDSVIKALRAKEPTDWKELTGKHDSQGFTHPELKEKYADDVLYFYIPESYRTDTPFALMIFLHGGGEGTKRDYAQAITATPEQFKYSYDLRRYVEDIPVITVSPLGSRCQDQRSLVYRRCPTARD